MRRECYRWRIWSRLLRNEGSGYKQQQGRAAGCELRDDSHPGPLRLSRFDAATIDCAAFPSVL
jgi:hypothetical protein